MRYDREDVQTFMQFRKANELMTSDIEGKMAKVADDAGTFDEEHLAKVLGGHGIAADFKNWLEKGAVVPEPEEAV